MKYGPDYKWRVHWIGSCRVAVVVDLDKGGRSVTNAIDDIADVLGVDHIVYCDSMGQWDYWDRKRGFLPLAVVPEGKKDPIPCPTMDLALEIAKARYILPLKKPPHGNS